MSITSSLPTPYVTLTEADDLITTYSPWSSASEDQKNGALGWARVYFDAVYICYTIDLESTEVADIPSDIKLANSLLANYQLTESLFSRNSDTKNLIEKEIKVTGLSTRKRFVNKFVDPFPEITALIKSSCRINTGAGVKSVVRA